MWIFPQNADNIPGTWIFPPNVDNSTIISTTIMKYSNLPHNLTLHLYALHGTQQLRKFIPWPWRVLSLTWRWRSLPHCPPGAFDILHITVWFLRFCIFFIQQLAFNNGDNSFGCNFFNSLRTLTQPPLCESTSFVMDVIFPPWLGQNYQQRIMHVLWYWLMKVLNCHSSLFTVWRNYP